MAQAVNDIAAGSDEPSFLERHHFLLRRLHSLSGVFPIGMFVIFHLFTNMQILRGGEHFQHEVDFIHSTPALLFVEIFVLWLPIAFHAGLGIVYTFTGKSNTANYGWAANWRYTLQRVTGILALIFIFLHIATLRWGWNILGWHTPFFAYYYVEGERVGLATYSTALALQSSVWVLVLYAIGVYAAVYHWANGLWTAAITWGLTLSVKAQQRWGYFCIALFLALATFAGLAIYGSMTYQPTELERTAYQAAISDPDYTWFYHDVMADPPPAAVTPSE